MSRDRLRTSLFWLSTGFSVIMFSLVALNAFILIGNQATQRDINQRQQFINQTAALSRVYETLVRSLAQATASTNDERLRSLLALNGITVTVTPNPAPGSAPAPTPGPAPAPGTTTTPPAN